MERTHREIQIYAERFTTPPAPWLEEIVSRTEREHPQAHMMSSRLQGKLLEWVSLWRRPSRVLEIGTFTGYSALCLATGLAPGGMLHTIELQEETARLAQANFNQSEFRDRIILHQGNALEVIPRLKETWDLVFIDADKSAYVKYYELSLASLRPGGLILADNVLFRGEVLDDRPQGRSAAALSAFNALVRDDERVEQLLLPIRDGLMIIQKK